MTNFGFLQAEWSEDFESATKAEALANPDTSAACFYARQTLELAVAWLRLISRVIAATQKRPRSHRR